MIYHEQFIFLSQLIRSKSSKIQLHTSEFYFILKILKKKDEKTEIRKYVLYAAKLNCFFNNVTIHANFSQKLRLKFVAADTH